MQLPNILNSFANDPRGDVIFLAVVMETGTPGQEASTSYAQTYANQKNLNFPTVADVNGITDRYFAEPAYPFNMFIDARTMTITRVFHGGDTDAVETEIERILNLN